MKLAQFVIAALFGASLFIMAPACGGEKEKKGNPTLTKNVAAMATQACACVDAGKKGCMDIEVDGKKGMALFMKSDTKDLTAAEMEIFQKSRSSWNDCFKPDYKRKGGDK